MKSRAAFTLLAGLIASVLLALSPAPRLAVDFTAEQLRMIRTLSPVPAPELPGSNPFADSERAAHFGQFLFYDTRLSSNGEVSCATCHDPELDWTDGKARAETHAPLAKNTMSLWNVAWNRWFFWDGRADSLWSQALIPLEHPDEMGLTRLEIAHLFMREADLRDGYEAVFGALPDFRDTARFPKRARPRRQAGNPVATMFGSAEPEADPLDDEWNAMSEADRLAVDTFFSNLGKAMAAFERKLISVEAPFDVFVAGLVADDAERIAAISEDAQHGLKLFLEKECVNCHHSPLLSDREFHNIGLEALPELPTDEGRPDGIHAVRADPFNGVGAHSAAPDWDDNPYLRYVFINEHVFGAYKTPSLRNVVRTAPYMHDGRFETLEDVLVFYSTLPGAPPIGHREETMKPAAFTPDERRQLIAFLESLSGPGVPPALASAPESPVP